MLKCGQIMRKVTAQRRSAIRTGPQLRIRRVAQFIAVCRRVKMVAMGTRRPRRGARLCGRWALKWRDDGELLGQCSRATKCDKLSGACLSIARSLGCGCETVKCK